MASHQALHFVRDASWKTRRRASPPGGHPVPRANGYCTSARQGDLPGFGLAQELGGPLPPALRRHQPTKESQEYVDAITRDVHWLGFDWGPHFTSRATTSAGSTSGRSSSSRGQGVRDDLSATRSASTAHADRARAGEPVAQPAGRRERDLSSACARAVRGREQGPAREDRHGPSQPQPARSGDVPHPQDRAPTDRRHLVRVPDVRLGPRPVRLDRGVTHSLCTLEYEDHARFTTGTSTRSGSTTRARSSSRPELSHTVMSKRKLLTLVQDGL